MFSRLMLQSFLILSSSVSFSQIQIGTVGTTSSTNGETPVRTYYKNLKTQYLVRASEITAAGGTPGGITSLAIYVSNTPATALLNFRISMKATSLTSLSGTGMETGFTEVYSSASQSTASLAATGWKTFTTTGFNWDGTSNIIIQFCWGHNSSWGSNGEVHVTSPGYNCGKYYDNDTDPGGGGCNFNTSEGLLTRRPILQLTINPCSGTPSISTQPTNDTTYVNSCGIARFNSGSSSGTALNYQWEFSTNSGASWSDATGVNYLNATTPNLKVVSPPSTFNGYLYRCRIWNCNGTVYSNSARLAVITWIKNIVINEVMVNPTGGMCYDAQSLCIQTNVTQGCTQPFMHDVDIYTTDGKEWIELYNPYCVAIDLSHWFLATRSSMGDGHGVLRFPSGTSIPANGYLSIGGKNTSADIKVYDLYNAYGSANVRTETIRWYLENIDGWVGLYGPKGNPVDAVYWTYDSGQSSRWGTDSDIYDAPTLIPVGSAGAPLVTDSLPGPRSTCLTAVKDYLGTLNGNLSFERSTDGGSIWQGSNNAGGSSISSTNLVSNTCLVLPIEMVDFFAVLENKEVYLTWQTASEHNNDYFIIERSRDGIEWEFLDKIDGAGNSTTLLSYRTYDLNPYRGVGYYRLKQVDYDGKSSYSEIRSVYNTEQLAIMPNPSSGIFGIGGMPDHSENNILLMDISGKILEQHTTEEVSYQLDLTARPDGIYIVLINGTHPIRIFKK